MATLVNGQKSHELELKNLTMGQNDLVATAGCDVQTSYAEMAADIQRVEAGMAEVTEKQAKIDT